MSRWSALYDELAGARYPGLVGYAGLLTADPQTADALVASALRRTFGKRRRFAGLGPAEHEVRKAIVAEFLAQKAAAGTARPDPKTAARPDEPAPTDDLMPPETPGARADHGRADHGRVDRGGADPRANPYAPPGSDGDDTAAQADADHEPARASAAVAPERHTPPTVRDGAAGLADAMPRDEAQLRAALQTLSPRSRAVAVLRYHDGLTPGQIGERLELTMETVRPVLHEVRDVVRVHLGLVLTDDAFESEQAGAAEITVAAHARRAAR